MSTNDVRYPDIKVKLTGKDGNAFVVLGRVKDALREAKVPQADITKFLRQATSGDYDHLLQMCMQWVTVS